MKKTYYHAVTMDKMVSIMRSGLIKNITDNGVYFTDDAISSLDWIRYREELWFKNKHKSLGLVIFEVDTDDDNIVPYKDYVTSSHHSYPQQWKEAQKAECIVYQKSIHPSLLKFEECFIDGDEYDCYEKTNTQKYVHPTKKMRIDLMIKGLKNMCGYDPSTNEYVVVEKQAYKQIKGNPKLAEEFYDRNLQYWKEHPKQLKPFGGTLAV
jgi:hypothetical protein